MMCYCNIPKNSYLLKVRFKAYKDCYVKIESENRIWILIYILFVT
jgi:hypothetical protein